MVSHVRHQLHPAGTAHGVRNVVRRAQPHPVRTAWMTFSSSEAVGRSAGVYTAGARVRGRPPPARADALQPRSHIPAAVARYAVTTHSGSPPRCPQQSRRELRATEARRAPRGSERLQPVPGDGAESVAEASSSSPHRPVELAAQSAGAVTALAGHPMTCSRLARFGGRISPDSRGALCML